MKDNYIHICFIIDESGSMYGTENDVVGGFNKMIDEQKQLTDGECSISLYKFNNNVSELYVGRNVNNVTHLTAAKSKYIYPYTEPEGVSQEEVYSPHGSTAMNDGIGMAIDNIGKWLSDMPECERPSKNLIVIMTDGEENCSTDYTLDQVKAMIKEQTEKYSWDFMYIGTDITTTTAADNLGVKYKAYSTRDDYDSNWGVINNATKTFRSSQSALAASTMDCCMKMDIDNMNEIYLQKTGLNMKGES